MKITSPAQRAAFGGILTALGVVCLIAAAYLPAGRLGFYFIAAFLPAIATVEGHRGLAALCSAAALGVALLLLPNKIAVLPYACFLGWYACLRDAFSRLSRVFRTLLLLLCFNAGVLVWGFLLARVFGIGPAELFPLEMTPLLWAVAIVALQIAFLAVDFFFGLFVDYYVQRIKPKLFGR
ncbi:MAG: hypothetical protein ACOYIR_02405 [Christensenellales bacterium]|jgi:hypothetical protein